MKATLTVILGFLIAESAFGALKKESVPAPGKGQNLTPEQIVELREKGRQDYYRRTGGLIFRKGHGNGKVVFFNCQVKVPESNIVATAKSLATRTRIRFEVEHSTVTKLDTRHFSTQVKKSGAAAGVFVIDQPEVDTPIVAAPEGRWAVVNVSALASDGAAMPFVVARTQKEIFRALASCANGIDSQSKDAITGVMLKPSDLDEFAGLRIPVDVMSRVVKGLTKLGADPWRQTPYIRACEEGWAPAPTNDVQKAIWDKVHALPTEPLKINPETKKVDR